MPKHKITIKKVTNLRKLLCIKSGTGYKQFEVRPKSSNIFHQPKKNVCMQCALMSFVHNKDTENMVNNQGLESLTFTVTTAI